MAGVAMVEHGTKMFIPLVLIECQTVEPQTIECLKHCHGTSISSSITMHTNRILVGGFKPSEKY